MNGGSLSASATLPTAPTSTGSIPESSLLPIPPAGNVEAQVQQGQQLLNQVQAAIGGDNSAQVSLLKAGTTFVQNATSGLPRTLITDALGVATGFAVGGPVGGIAAVAGVAVSLFTSLFSGGAPPEWEGWQSQPSPADQHIWTLLQYYMFQTTGGTQSGYPPGWWLSLYMNRTRAPWTSKRLAGLPPLVKGTFRAPGGDAYAVSLMQSLGGNDIGNGFVPSSILSPTYKVDLEPIPPYFFYIWADPAGTGLSGMLSQGFPVPQASGPPTGIQVPLTGEEPIPGQQGNPDEGAVSASSLWQSVLDDIVPHARLSKATIGKRALAMMPDPLWWSQDLYTTNFADSSGNFGGYIFQTGLLNAMATVLSMATMGAHPRAITSELLMQHSTIKQFGGQGGSPGHVTAAHQQFLDEWLDAASKHVASPRKTPASPLRSKTTAPKLSAPLYSAAKKAQAASSAFTSPDFLYPAVGLGTALALYAGYKYLR